VNLTQPALTQVIAGLEASLGVALFVRSAQGMAPTEPALLLAPRAEAAIAHIGSPRDGRAGARAAGAGARGSYAAAGEATGLPAPACTALSPICRWRWGKAWWSGAGSMWG
jgi:DNA-binding transcriptional LysR family regulator